MLHTNNPIIKHKVSLNNLTEELSNVSKGCKIMGVSRNTICRYQDRLKKTIFMQFYPQIALQPQYPVVHGGKLNIVSRYIHGCIPIGVVEA